jgi:hypothetical protein
VSDVLGSITSEIVNSFRKTFTAEEEEDEADNDTHTHASDVTPLGSMSPWVFGLNENT